MRYLTLVFSSISVAVMWVVIMILMVVNVVVTGIMEFIDFHLDDQFEVMLSAWRGEDGDEVS